MYHSIIDITGENDIASGEEVVLDISPMYINSNIRREYV